MTNSKLTDKQAQEILKDAIHKSVITYGILTIDTSNGIDIKLKVADYNSKTFDNTNDAMFYCQQQAKIDGVMLTPIDLISHETGTVIAFQLPNLNLKLAKK